MVRELSEGLNLPKSEMCPVCQSKDTRPDYDFPMTMKNCNSCGSEWVSNSARGTQDITFNSREFEDVYDHTTQTVWNDYNEEQIDLHCPECGSDDIDNWFNPDQPVNNQVATCRNCEYVGPKEEFEEIINEQKQLTMGKLTLLEVLTSADIQQITKIAADEAKREARKVKDDINKDITTIKKTQTDDKKNIDKDIKSVKDDIDKTLNSKELDKKVKELIADTMVKYHQTLWVKRGFWTSGLTK
jgi:RNA polymerase subunit RPABC4/transcription elongation factor Spt4